MRRAARCICRASLRAAASIFVAALSLGAWRLELGRYILAVSIMTTIMAKDDEGHNLVVPAQAGVHQEGMYKDVSGYVGAHRNMQRYGAWELEGA